MKTNLDGITAIKLITEERNRQQTHEGWSTDHDDEHEEGELAMAASCYALLPCWRPADMAPLGWPWSNTEPMDGFKPSPNDRIRELVKSGALIVAEIERLIRLQRSEKKEFKCYEIHVVQARMFECKKQCDECREVQLQRAANDAAEKP